MFQCIFHFIDVAFVFQGCFPDYLFFYYRDVRCRIMIKDVNFVKQREEIKITAISITTAAEQNIFSFNNKTTMTHTY